MRFYVGVTDYNWFRFLQEQRPDEVNFWKPGGLAKFQPVEPGSLFLFKLHKPRHYIVGGGIFVDYVRLPLPTAWEDFGTKNGTADYNTFLNSINNYRRLSSLQASNAGIGCIILASPFFLEERDWIPAPDSWANSIVQGKTFDSTEGDGRVLWDRITPFISSTAYSSSVEESSVIREYPAEYIGRPVLGAQYLRTARLGQGAFRAIILDQYKKCCITGENTEPVLQAAHIKPVAEGGVHSLRNGLLLRADIHILFDKGLIGVTPDYKIRISPRIRNQFLNGKVYYAHDGQELRASPKDRSLLPDPELLALHMREKFVTE